MPSTQQPLAYYKYRSFDTDLEISRVRSILWEHKLYAPTPSELNDPFDCCEDISVDASDEDHRAAAIAWLNKSQPNLSANQVQELVPRTIKQCLLTGTESIREYVQSTGIVSLATDFKNPLLWAHYAGAHTGICIEFNLEDASMGIFGRFSEASAVRYQGDRPKPNFFADNKIDTVKRMVFTKSLDWKYEAEYRIIVSPRPADGAMPFHPDLISRVYVGCRMPQPKLDQLRQLLSERPAATKPQLLKVKPSTELYELVC